MNMESISSTQFADACKIPRPTVSQILSGRNKKISDEVIGKIHEAYPNLSVLWLLFGEGAMLVNQNTQISEPQNGGFIDFYNAQNGEPMQDSSSENSENSDSVFPSDNSGEASIFDFDAKQDRPGTQISISGDDDTDSSSHRLDSSRPRQVSIAADASKSIVNITVFYSDNSFQTFLPAK